jgi:tRNA(Ile)-lysidine synthase
MNSRAISPVERAIAAALDRVPVRRGGRILIALSGGADSIALTHALCRLRDADRQPGYNLVAAHLNHRLRGAESDRDERFVRELCECLQIELTVERAHNLAESSNLEERARDLRYEFLNRTADRFGATCIALAHHADDQAETVMLRLLRGSGATGLAAMSAVGPGRIVRPMLALRRGQILAYLQALGAEYVTDSSNLSPAILRNRVRLELLPMLDRDYAPKLSRRLAELAVEMRLLDNYLTGEARRELDRRLQTPSRLDLAGFSTLPPALANAMLREWLRRRIGGLRRIHRADIARISRLCEAASPGSIAGLSDGWRLRCEYGTAVLESTPAISARSFAVELACDGSTVVADAGFAFDARIFVAGDPAFPAEASIARAQRTEAWFDAEQIKGGLVVRGFRHGDRIRPLGMGGTRKVQDVLVDRKLPRERRANWPIVESNSEILWIPGMARSRYALVTASTRKLLQIKAKPLGRA